MTEPVAVAPAAPVAPARPSTRAPAIRYALPAIVLLALAIRVVVVLATPHFSPLEDSAAYDLSAVKLATTGSLPPSLETLHPGPSAFYPPFFPIVLAGLYKLVGTGTGRWEAARLLEAGFGAVLVLLIGLIATRVWDRRVGLIAAGIAAVCPSLVLIGSSILSESLFVPLVAGAVWAALVYRDERRLRWAALAAVMVGCAALTRGNGLLMALPVGWLLWGPGPARSWRAWRAPLALAGVVVVMLAPWAIRNEHRFHRFVPVATETGYTLYGTFNAAVQTQEKRWPAMWQMPQALVQQLYRQDRHASEASISDTLTTDALHYIRRHPVSLLHTAYWNTVRLLDLTPSIERAYAPFERYPTWLAMLSVYAFWVLLPLIVAGALTRRARAAPRALWAVPALLYLSTVFLLGMTRGRSPADPFLIMLAALAVAEAWRRLRISRA